MTTALGKEIILSYAPADRELAERCSAILRDWFGRSSWLREFDLDGGQLVADALDEAIGDARWFLLLLSSASAESSWVQQEATLATFRAIEGESFRILILRLDSSPVPRHLTTALKVSTVLQVEPEEEVELAFLRVAEIIEEAGDTRANEIYVDRGADSDRFALTARRNRVVFIIGFAGIGKTAFCRNSVTATLRKRPLILRLTRGHSLDLLAREILSRCHMPQPPEDSITDDELMNLALNAIDRRSTKFYLLLDNAEDATDANNSLLPFLEHFLVEYIKRGIDTHVILASTRHPDYSPAIASSSDILRVGPIESIYIREGLDLWLSGTPQYQAVLASPDLDRLVEMASGFPLAAKLLASHLKADRAPSQLLTSGQRKRFELKFAAHLLRTVDTDLNELEQLILHVLAGIREPMSVSDLMTISLVRNHGATDVQNAIGRLTEFFLIQQTGEVLSMHRFLRIFYEDQLHPLVARRKVIAEEYGRYAFERAIELSALIDRATTHEGMTPSNAEIVRLSNLALRYAVPAGRLLRAVGDDERADRLPFRIKGTLREMVFYQYQEERDYLAALKYAEQWMRISPDDIEVRLYQARCYRNLGGDDNLARAERILNQLEPRGTSPYFQAKILREKGIVAERRGEDADAERWYSEGISLAPERYPDNHVALAQLILRRTVEWPEYKHEYVLIERAISLLEEARAKSATFDRYYIGSYIEALVRVGRMDDAFPLMMEALEDNPTDPRINYRLGELYRKSGQLDPAERFAKEAVRAGSIRAQLTLANTYCARAIEALEEGNVSVSSDYLNSARHALDRFRPDFGHDQEVAAGIRAKTYRLEGNWSKAEEVLKPYEQSENPFTVYEQSKAALQRVAEAAEPGEAKRQLLQLKARLEHLDRSRGLSDPLLELLGKVRDLLH